MWERNLFCIRALRNDVWQDTSPIKRRGGGGTNQVMQYAIGIMTRVSTALYIMTRDITRGITGSDLSGTDIRRSDIRY